VAIVVVVVMIFVILVVFGWFGVSCSGYEVGLMMMPDVCVLLDLADARG
jgi:hypothetical protein